jgi:hypothetical protein
MGVAAVDVSFSNGHNGLHHCGGEETPEKGDAAATAAAAPRNPLPRPSGKIKNGQHDAARGREAAHEGATGVGLPRGGGRRRVFVGRGRARFFAGPSAAEGAVDAGPACVAGSGARGALRGVRRIYREDDPAPKRRTRGGRGRHQDHKARRGRARGGPRPVLVYMLRAGQGVFRENSAAVPRQGFLCRVSTIREETDARLLGLRAI